jgi:hypothetical protein
MKKYMFDLNGFKSGTVYVETDRWYFFTISYDGLFLAESIGDCYIIDTNNKGQLIICGVDII